MCYIVKVTGGSTPSYYLGNNAMKALTIEKAKKFNDFDEADTAAAKWLLQMMKAHWDSAKAEVVEIDNE